MANTYELIKEFSVGRTGITNIELLGIPQSYKDLELVLSAQSEGSNGTISVFFNGDFTDSNYFVRRMAQLSTSSSTATFTGPYFAYGNNDIYTLPFFSGGKVYIPDYTSSANKTISGETTQNGANSINGQAYYSGGYWSNTAAINRITLRFTLDPQFSYNSNVRLYGISS